jgi:hypothetical protein
MSRDDKRGEEFLTGRREGGKKLWIQIAFKRRGGLNEEWP